MTKKYEVVETREERLVDVICDVCHRTCRTNDDPALYEYAVLSAVWGYGSSKDGEKHTAYICSLCYDKLLEFIVNLGGSVPVEYYGPDIYKLSEETEEEDDGPERAEEPSQ